MFFTHNFNTLKPTTYWNFETLVQTTAYESSIDGPNNQHHLKTATNVSRLYQTVANIYSFNNAI